MKDRKLYVMCGLPGAGKSTFVKNFSDKESVVISMDSIRAIYFGNRQNQSHNKKVFKIAKKILDAVSKNKTCNVFWDATSLTKKNREIFFEYRNYFDKIICIYCSTSDVVCRNRQHLRPLEERVPATVISNMAYRFEEPHLDEGFDTIYIIYNQF